MGYLNTGGGKSEGSANLMTEGNREDWENACRIAAQALDYGCGLIRPGAKVRDIAESVEKKILELGGQMAFPAQLSLDSTAAHSCPDVNDATELKSELVKLDIGVHVNGWIGDNARTVDLSGQHAALVKASRDALEAAVKLMRPEVRLAEVGRAIQETISAAGFAPIRNLSGHGLGQYMVHIAPNVPNFDSGERTVLQEGQVFAVEPFATSGQGLVVDTSNATIFSIVQQRPQRDAGAKQLLEHCAHYNGLPFAARWLAPLMPQFRLSLALRSLQSSGAMRAYPPLVEKTRGLVSQAEYTVLVKDKPVVLTRS